MIASSRTVIIAHHTAPHHPMPLSSFPYPPPVPILNPLPQSSLSPPPFPRVHAPGPGRVSGPATNGAGRGTFLSRLEVRLVCARSFTSRHTNPLLAFRYVFCPTWKCVIPAQGPSHQGTPTPSRRTVQGGDTKPALGRARRDKTGRQREANKALTSMHQLAARYAFCPAWKCVMRRRGPSYPGTTTFCWPPGGSCYMFTYWPAWKCVRRAEGPSHPGTPTSSTRLETS